MTADPILARHAARPVPRYTSYPTAPHFETEFPEQTVRDWYRALDPRNPVSLYLHVPFCKQMCWYCGCNMKLASKYSPLAAYAETLRTEVETTARALPGHLPVAHLHWGGGTPTALSPEDLIACMDAVSRRFEFTPDAELALESDPRTLTAEMAETVGALGFTRASFGVQEFDPRVQIAINRVQPPEMVAEAVGRLRRAGVGEINFDLIYGLPHQTVESLVRTVRLAADMGPGRIALFGYAHVPWMAKNQRMIPEDALPGPDARAAQAEAAAEELAAMGYIPIGLDHFALPDDPMAKAWREGRLRRNFQGYTTDTAETLIPFGATSIGRTPQGWIQNTAETGAWSRAVLAGRLPVAKGLALSADDRLRAWVIERLMCDFAVDTREAARRFGAAPDWAEDSLARLAPMVEDGLVTVQAGRVALAPKARSLSRVAAAAFDAYLDQGKARHSAAV